MSWVSSTNTRPQLQKHAASAWELAQEHFPDLLCEHGERQSPGRQRSIASGGVGLLGVLPPTAAPRQPHSCPHTHSFDLFSAHFPDFSSSVSPLASSPSSRKAGLFPGREAGHHEWRRETPEG